MCARLVMPLRPITIQTRLALSMLYQVKSKLKYNHRMSANDLIDANPHIIDRIKMAIEMDYAITCTEENIRNAAQMLIMGMREYN